MALFQARRIEIGSTWNIYQYPHENYEIEKQNDYALGENEFKL
jgi:hypothetical protein